MYKVLIVDDNYLQIQNLFFFFSRWNDLPIAEIKTAQDGAEGLHIFKDLNPEIVITDVSMPQMNGLEMTKEMLKLNSKTKFIFISCYEDFSYIKEAMEGGAVAYILKPIDEKTLKEALHKVIGKMEYEASYDNMSSLLKESMDIYRKNFFYKLIYSRNIEPEYLKSTIVNLGLNEFHNFLIAKISISNSKGRFIDIYNLINLTEHRLKIDKNTMVAVESESYLDVMFMSEDSDDASFISYCKQCLLDYSRYVLENFHVNLRIGLSLVFNDLKEPQTLLSQASCALESHHESSGDIIKTYSGSGKIPLITDIIKYINKNYKTITGVSQIAENFYISESYARKIFKNQTGKTIFYVLLSKKMEEAKKLLLNPDMKIHEVSELVGYHDKRNFIDSFKKYTGYLPKEYQQKAVTGDYEIAKEKQCFSEGTAL